ncbi:MAG: xylose isomerase, partial [Paracoccaceae bacterium]
MSEFFGDISRIAYQVANSTNPLAFRHSDKHQLVMGKRLEEHLRFAVAYWHSFAWQGHDPFGGPTFDRPWFGDDMASAERKADVAFEMFALLGAPYFCFHDADVRPEGETFSQSVKRLNRLGDIFEQKMSQSRVRLLWGTANLFTNARFMAG